MARAFVLVMDSVGIGGAPDAARFFNGDIPDTGANTLAHIVEETGLYLPNLDGLGLGAALGLASGVTLEGWAEAPNACYGAATEVSNGKDTPSGHWELAGLPVPWDWHVFPEQTPAFPAHLCDLAARLAGTDGILGNCHSSGTVVLERLAEAHIETGWPICYTSADSVFQIAAHEEHFGLQRLLNLCQDLAPHLHKMRVGRVIARPFVGQGRHFTRTKNRRDFAMTPPSPVLTTWVQDAGGHVHAIGKIDDIFSGQGIDTKSKGTDAELVENLLSTLETLPDGGLCFANFVEFDSLYGHRRDVAGYAGHLAWFDREIGRLLPKLREGDLLIITADHGNDPTWVGTDHTRERVPVLIAGAGQGKAGETGLVAFADVAASVAAHLGVPVRGPGRSFL